MKKNTYQVRYADSMSYDSGVMSDNLTKKEAEYIKNLLMSDMKTSKVYYVHDTMPFKGLWHYIKLPFTYIKNKLLKAVDKR